MPTTLTAQQYTTLLRDLRRIISEGQAIANSAAYETYRAVTTPVQADYQPISDQLAQIDDELGKAADNIETIRDDIIVLTDNLEDRTRWMLPMGTVLPPGGYLLVWADDEPAEGLLHATFRLSAREETISFC